QELRGRGAHPLPELARVDGLGDRQRVEVDDAEDVVALVLASDPLAQRPDVAAQVEDPGGLDAGEDARATGRSFHEGQVYAGPAHRPRPPRRRSRPGPVDP